MDYRDEYSLYRAWYAVRTHEVSMRCARCGEYKPLTELFFDNCTMKIHDKVFNKKISYRDYLYCFRCRSDIDADVSSLP